MARAFGGRESLHALFLPPNPPSLAMLLAPLGWLDQGSARLTLTAAGLVVLFASLAVLVRRVPLEGVLAPGFVCLAVLSRPVRTNFAEGQVYVLLLGLAVCAWRAWETRREAALGAVLGLAAAFKLAFPGVWLLALVLRRFRALAWAAGTLAGIEAITFLVKPGVSWRPWLEGFPHYDFDLTTPYFQAPFGLAGRLLRLALPAARVPAAAACLAAAASIAAVCVIVRCRRSPRHAFGAAVLASLVVSPYSSTYHYVPALVPIAFLLAPGRARESAISALFLAVGIALVVAAPDWSGRFSDWRMVLEYPLLIGTWILLVLTDRAASHAAPEP
jgi:alpha-1,2-mannosyltransferase